MSNMKTFILKKYMFFYLFYIYYILLKVLFTKLVINLLLTELIRITLM